jgi:hypothetical protein
MEAVAWTVVSGIVAGLSAAAPWMVYANRVVPSLANASARPAAYLVAAIPAMVTTVLTLAVLLGFTTGSLRNDIVLIAATAAVACAWGPIVRGALSISGGPSALRAPTSPDGTEVDDGGSRAHTARTIGFALGVSLFMVTMTSFAIPATASFVACVDTERILADAKPPPPANTARIQDALSYNQPEPGAQYIHNFPASLDLIATWKHDPETREQLVAAGFVGAHVKQWVADDENWIEAEIIEFATPEGASTYQAQAHRHACGYADEAFEAPMGGIGLQVRYETGAPYVEQISWVADNRRYKVQISAYARPSDHSRILGIHEVVTNAWPPEPPQTAEEPPAPATPDASIEEGAAMEEVRAAVEATLAEETLRVSKDVEFAGSSEIPDTAEASTGGQVSLDVTRRMRVLIQSADTPADLEDSSIELIVDDQRVYLHGRVIDPYVGEGHWLTFDLATEDSRAEPFKELVSGHNDASMVLFYLYGVTRVLSGADDVIHEQPARRYTVEIDLQAALEPLPPEYVDRLRRNLAAVRRAGIDTALDAVIWVGQDGLVHRIEYQQALGTEMGGGTMSISADLSDFGMPLELDLPPTEHVTRIEDVKGPGQRLPKG